MSPKIETEPWEPRHIQPKEGGYGWSRSSWYPGYSWWAYLNLSYTVDAYVYDLASGEFLAISFALYIDDGVLKCSTTCQVCQTLELGMDFCEAAMKEKGLVP